jgi:hypothetical protein
LVVGLKASSDGLSHPAPSYLLRLMNSRCFVCMRIRPHPQRDTQLVTSLLVETNIFLF